MKFWKYGSPRKRERYFSLYTLLFSSLGIVLQLWATRGDCLRSEEISEYSYTLGQKYFYSVPNETLSILEGKDFNKN